MRQLVAERYRLDAEQDAGCKMRHLDKHAGPSFAAARGPHTVSSDLLEV